MAGDEIERFTPLKQHMVGSPKGGWVLYEDHAARLTALEQENKRLRDNMRETYEAMVAMRNTINEHIPMPSIESDLLSGPESSVFCSRVAQSVIAALTHEDKP